MINLLLVEDDVAVSQPLAEQLRQANFSVQIADCLKVARDFDLQLFQLILLDWQLPDGQGIDFLKELRLKNLTLPIILLTARKDVTDKIVGLELGADDYLTKPFDVKELIARIRVRLREPVGSKVAELKAGSLVLNLTTRRVLFHGQDIDLTRKEFELLQFFMENTDRALARDEILNRVWGFDNFPTSRTVDTHVLSLRQKLAPDFFETLRGTGYRFKVSA